jgi:hypothetical protein
MGTHRFEHTVGGKDIIVYLAVGCQRSLPYIRVCSEVVHSFHPGQCFLPPVTQEVCLDKCYLACLNMTFNIPAITVHQRIDYNHAIAPGDQGVHEV